MSFELAFKLSSYLLVLDGLYALSLTRLFSPVSFALLLFAFGLSFWTEKLQALASKRLWDILTILFLGFLILDLLFLAPSFVAGVIHLLTFVTLYKLFNRRSTRDYLDLYILSFFQLVAASAFTINLAFFLAFITYLILGTWTFLLLHLRREVEASGRSDLQARLHSSHLFGPSFLLTSFGVSLGAFFLTAAFFAILPRVGRAYLPLSWRPGTMVTGFSDRVELGTFGSIQTDPTIIMRVQLPDLDGKTAAGLDLKWRGIAFDTFDGRSWALSGSLKRVLLRRQGGIFQIRRARGQPLLKQEIYLDPIGTETLFAVPTLVSLAAPFPTLLLDQLGSVSLAAPPSSRIRYLAFSAMEEVSWEPLDREERERYLSLPPLLPRIRALARSLTEGARTAFEKAKRVEAYLQKNYRYSLTLPPAKGLTPLEGFLFETRQGNCEYFAASMAVLLRSVGVPARVVNGFQKGEWNEFGGYYAVRQKDAHSWVEVYLDGQGWATFDPSPRTEFEAGFSAPSGLLARYVDALKMRWNRYVIDYNLGDQILLALTLKRRSEAVREEIGKGLSWLTRGLAGLRESLPGVRAPLALAILTILALLVLFRPFRQQPGLFRARLFKAHRSRRSVPFYERALKLLAKRGFVKTPSLTPWEFAEELCRKDPGLQAVGELFEFYYRVRFGEKPLSPPEEERVKALLSELAGHR